MSQQETRFAVGFDYPSDPTTAVFWLSVNGTTSIQSTYARNAGKGLRVQPSAGTAYRQKEFDSGGTTAPLTAQIYMYFVTLPNSDCNILSFYRTAGADVHIGLAWNNSTSKIRAYSWDSAKTTQTYSADGIAPSADTWYRFDIDIDTTAGSEWTIDWSAAVDTATAVAQPSISAGGGAFGLLSAIFGVYDSSTTADIVYDDAVGIGGNATFPTYPLSAGRVAYISVDGDGTHNNSGDFTDDAANSPPAADAYLRLDEGPGTSITDYVYQSTFNGASYLEFSLEDLPSGIAENRLHAGVLRIARSSPAGQASELSIGKAWSVDDSDTFGNVDVGSPVTGNKLYKTNKLAPVGGAETDWSVAKVNNSVVRVGYETDPGSGYGEQYIHDIHEEWGLIEQVGADHWAWAEGTDDMDSWQVIG